MRHRPRRGRAHLRYWLRRGRRNSTDVASCRYNDVKPLPELSNDLARMVFRGSELGLLPE
jgi:hypothetical protein